jgi:hypothetical protein
MSDPETSLLREPDSAGSLPAAIERAVTGRLAPGGFHDG